MVRRVLAALPLLLLGVAVQASIPGNIQQRSREGLQHVCVDTEPTKPDDYIECQLQVDGFVDAPYTAQECTDVGLPAECVLDFIPKVRLKGTVTIVMDEVARTGADDDAGEQTALIFDLKAKKKKLRIIELFEGSRIGNWNTIGVESGLLQGGINYVHPSGGSYQYANGNLTDFGDKLIAMVDPLFPKANLSVTLPVVTKLEKIEKKSVDAQADETASATVWKLTIEFVRVRN